MVPAKVILFLSAVLTAGTTPATRPPREEEGGCEWKGQHYQEGDTFHPDRCHTCVCHDGTVACTTPGCPPTPCPNPVPDPHRCGCPSCPHDNSCLLPNGTAISAGQLVLLGTYAICRCDDTTQSPTTIADAVCQYIFK